MKPLNTKILMAVILGLVALIASLIYLTLSNTASTQTTAFDTPTTYMTNTPSDLRLRELPPTWTPPAEPTRDPFVAATPQERTLTPEKNPALDSLYPPFLLTGSGSSDTRLFSLTAGETKIYWEYSGKPGESGNLRYAQSQHIKKLDALKTAYNAALDAYKNEEQAAKDRNDTDAVQKTQKNIDSLTEDYYKKVQEENDRYQKEIESYLSTFAIQIKRNSTEPVTLVSERGVFSGYADYDCTQAAQDYLLSITASGSWKITITPYQP
jgi:hypothetical protein